MWTTTICKQPLKLQSGLTLIELMVALLVGLFLMLGSLTMFQQSQANFRVANSVARLQENGRFALETIEPDIRLAKFWGRSAEPGLINSAIPAAVVVACDTVDTSAGMNPPTTYTRWVLNFSRELWVVDETSGYGHNQLGIPCSPATAAQPTSDVLVVRHAAGQTAVPTNGMVQVQTDLGRSDIFNDGAVPPGYGAFAQTHNVIVNIYYVDQSSDLDPAMPSLRLKTLVPGGTHQDQEVISGVENMQVQLGVDTDNDGEVERYVNANHPIIDPTNPASIPGAEVIAMRLWMLLRTDRAETGFIDRLQYLTPDTDIVVNTCAPGGGCAYPSSSRRLVMSKTVYLRNNRNVSGI